MRMFVEVKVCVLKMNIENIEAEFLQHFDNFKPVDSRCRRHLIDFGTLLAYPVIIIYMWEYLIIYMWAYLIIYMWAYLSVSTCEHI